MHNQEILNLVKHTTDKSEKGEVGRILWISRINDGGLNISFRCYSIGIVCCRMCFESTNETNTIHLHCILCKPKTKNEKPPLPCNASPYSLLLTAQLTMN